MFPAPVPETCFCISHAICFTCPERRFVSTCVASAQVTQICINVDFLINKIKKKILHYGRNMRKPVHMEEAFGQGENKLPKLEVTWKFWPRNHGSHTSMWEKQRTEFKQLEFPWIKSVPFNWDHVQMITYHMISKLHIQSQSFATCLLTRKKFATYFIMMSKLLRSVQIYAEQNQIGVCRLLSTKHAG